MDAYPTPQEEQLVAEHPAHEEDDADDLTWVSPAGPDDFEINPQADINLARSGLSQDGHSGVLLPITRVSKRLPHTLHLYSYIGIFSDLMCFQLNKQTNIRIK